MSEERNWANNNAAGLNPAEHDPTITDSPAASRRVRRASGETRDATSTSTPLIQRRAPDSGPEQKRNPTLQMPILQEMSGTRTMSSEQVLFGEDVALMRKFSTLIMVLCILLIATVPFMGGSVPLQGILWGGSLFSIFTSAWIIVVLRDVSNYDQRIINISALLGLLIAFAGVLYLGIHSPAPLTILPALYFVARTQVGGIALAMYVVTATLQGGLAIGIMSGAFSDPGLFSGADTDFTVRIITQGLVQLVYLGTYSLARTSRAGTLVAMNKVVSAEAAFVEVRAALERVLAAGGVGHYTGEVLGQYKVGGIIGRGAMGEVYEAAHVETSQLAAAKVLHPHVLAKQTSIDRFFREAQAASALQSPHSVQILAASKPQAPMPYLIMERLHGYDLAHHLRMLRRLPIGDVITLVQQVGSVIDMAAAKGIVHRDLKPQNLFLAEEPQGSLWKVLDFGASKLSRHSGTLTQGRVIGTPAYMSPQQARGKNVDGAADRYSLAAIVYRALTGRPPFAGKDLPATLFSVVYAVPAQPSILCDMAPELDLVIAVGMAKQPQDRFGSAAEFAFALKQANDGFVDPALRHHAEVLIAAHPWGTLPSSSNK